MDHILPRNPDAVAVAEFGDSHDDPDVVEALGNLLLLGSAINRSIKADAYSSKREALAQSKFLLTRCHASAEPDAVCSANKLARAAQKVPTYREWNERNVRERQAWMAELAIEIWIEAAC